MITPRGNETQWIAGGALFIIAIAVYLGTLSHGYVLDDALVITENEFTQQGLAGWPQILTHDAFAGFFGRDKAGELVSGGRYRPLSQLMFALEFQLAGAQPAVGHALNVLLYGITCVAVFAFFRRLLTSSATRQIWLAAGIGALLFAVHPVHTEVVANIKGRDEILALLLTLASLMCIVGIRPESGPRNVLAGVFAGLALLAKEYAFALAALAPLAHYYFRSSSALEALKDSRWVIAVCAGYGVFRWQLGVGDSAMESRELMNNPFLVYENGKLIAMDFYQRSAMIFATLNHALQLLFVPHPLTHDYYPRHMELVTWHNSRPWIGLFAYVTLFALAITSIRRRWQAGFAIWLFLLPLLPVSNLFFPIGVHFAERFLYLPSLGFCLALAYGTKAILSRHGKNTMPWVAIPVAAVALTFAFKTIERNRAWASNLTLLSTDLATSPNSAKLRNALGGVLIETAWDDGRKTRDKAVLLTAIGHLDRALDIHPLYRSPYLLKGNALLYLDRPGDALRHYERAMQLGGPHVPTMLNAAVALARLRDFDAALKTLNHVAQIDFDNARLPMVRADVLRDAGQHRGEYLGDIPGAVAYLEEAHSLRPEDFETLRLLGIAHGIAQDPLTARRYFNKALKSASSPRERAIALINLGVSWRTDDPERSAQLFARGQAESPETAAQMARSKSEPR